MKLSNLPAAAIGLAFASTFAPAEPNPASHDWCANVILPQTRAFHVNPARPAVSVSGVRAEIELVDGVATTTLYVSVENPHPSEATEAELLLPVPHGAVVSGFDFEGAAPDSTAELLPGALARSTYDSIVAELKDPALLEFAGSHLVRSSVFPVPAQGSQMVKVRYENVVPVEGRRWDYVLPRSESLSVNVPWDVTVEIRSTQPIADVYSPSHDLPQVEGSGHRIFLRSRQGQTMEAGPLRLSVLLAEGAVTTTLFTSADPEGEGGWFLLLAGLGELPAGTDLPPREVTVVLDRSGSMAGEKFDQAVAAARQVIEGLAPGEAFQLIDYSNDVERFSNGSTIKSRASIADLRSYIGGLGANGGTNLDGALQAALAEAPREGFLPVVLFLTDGLATEGEQREHVIRERAEAANAHGRRIFTFGVGNDVNAPLLDALASRSRARATFVAPGDDVERAVSDVFEDLNGPVVTDLSLDVLNSHDIPHPRLVRDIYPQILPDLYSDDRLLLLGRYTTKDVGKFRLSGVRGDQRTSWELTYDFGRAQQRNDFVRRLWAMRRIAGLEDELRQAGADPSALASLQDDPKLGEIVSEMLHLATHHGVLTDSTAFLALEGTELGDHEELLEIACRENGDNNAIRSGQSGVALSQNVGINREQSWVNKSNCLYASDGQLVANDTVQTVAGRTFFRRGTCWVDGTLAQEKDAGEPDRVVLVGSEEYTRLVERFLESGRVGQLSLSGEILIQDGSETILIRSDEPVTEASAEPAEHQVEAPQEEAQTVTSGPVIRQQAPSNNGTSVIDW